MRPAAGEIAVWRIPLDGNGEIAWLAPAERAFAAAAIDPKVRRRRAAARTALRRVLGACLDVAPHEVAFALGEHGKPRVEGGPPFNVSHSGDTMLLAVSGAGQVGVDVEACRELDRDWAAVAERAFSPAERRSLAALPADERPDAALRTWVRKEAYAKARGAGFAYGFQLFTVRTIAAGDESLLVDDAQDAGAVAGWRLLDLAPPEGFVASLAHAGPPAAIRYRSYGELSS